MFGVIRHGFHKARKRYQCNASLYLRDALDDPLWRIPFTCQELRAIVRARRNNWEIVPGQRYYRQFGTYAGSTYTVCCIPEIDAICSKYGIYPDD